MNIKEFKDKFRAGMHTEAIIALIKDSGNDVDDYLGYLTMDDLKTHGENLDVMLSNRERLISLRDKHSINRPQIATMCGVSVHTVNSWFNPPTSKNSNPMPDKMLRLLKFELKVK